MEWLIPSIPMCIAVLGMHIFFCVERRRKRKRILHELDLSMRETERKLRAAVEFFVPDLGAFKELLEQQQGNVTDLRAFKEIWGAGEGVICRGKEEEKT